MSEAARPARTALCLCGGGITGAMYEIGALMALDDLLGGAEGTAGQGGFGVSDFDLYVGTSAGAALATLIASGVSPRRIFRALLDDDKGFLPVKRTDIFRFEARQGLGVARDLATIFLSQAGRALRGKLAWSDVLSDLGDALPAGIFSLHHFERFIEDVLEREKLPRSFGEVPHELYITANDLDSGHRVVFGAGPLVQVPIAKAICASSAIPIFFEPYRIGGRDYVDGACGKVEHADIALARGAELIVIVNPMVPLRNDPDREDLPTPLVGRGHLRDKGLIAVYKQTAKMSTRTKLHQGLRRYQASHPQASILLIEPREEEGDMFLHNPMNFSSRRRMMRYGYESAARQLVEKRDRYQAACARLGLSVSGRLQSPWELTA